MIMQPTYSFFFFFFNDTATTEIYTLSLHDALPISLPGPPPGKGDRSAALPASPSSTRPSPAPRSGSVPAPRWRDRKSTRLNSSHSQISYAVFCLKKKNTHTAYAVLCVEETSD